MHVGVNIFMRRVDMAANRADAVIKAAKDFFDNDRDDAPQHVIDKRIDDLSKIKARLIKLEQDVHIILQDDDDLSPDEKERHLEAMKESLQRIRTPMLLQKINQLLVRLSKRSRSSPLPTCRGCEDTGLRTLTKSLQDITIRDQVHPRSQSSANRPYLQGHGTQASQRFTNQRHQQDSGPQQVDGAKQGQQKPQGEIAGGISMFKYEGPRRHQQDSAQEQSKKIDPIVQKTAPNSSQVTKTPVQHQLQTRSLVTQRGDERENTWRTGNVRTLSDTRIHYNRRTEQEPTIDYKELAKQNPVKNPPITQIKDFHADTATLQSTLKALRVMLPQQPGQWRKYRLSRKEDQLELTLMRLLRIKFRSQDVMELAKALVEVSHVSNKLKEHGVNIDEKYYIIRLADQLPTRLKAEVYKWMYRASYSLQDVVCMLQTELDKFIRQREDSNNEPIELDNKDDHHLQLVTIKAEWFQKSTPAYGFLKYDPRNRQGSSAMQHRGESMRLNFTPAGKVKPCKYCDDEAHCAWECKVPYQQKKTAVQRKKLCYNCLSENHKVDRCIHKNCQHCNGRHFTGHCPQLKYSPNKPNQGFEPEDDEGPSKQLFQ